ncbi:hypothetical protein ACFL3G_06070 [Planctomycetota bacterium]
MTEDLYFIPVLDKAFQEAESEAALKNAFDEIERLGKQKQYREGFSNFKRFMRQVCKYQELWENDSMHQLITENATGTFDGTEEEEQVVFESIISHPEFKAKYEAVCREIGEDCGKHTTAIIRVFSGKRLIGEMTFAKAIGCESIEGIFPGSYTLKLDIGRVIWKGNLAGKDLIWTEAFGTKRLDLAAETEDIERQPTRKIMLLDGDVVLHTFAGIESGSIEVELTK